MPAGTVSTPALPVQVELRPGGRGPAGGPGAGGDAGRGRPNRPSRHTHRMGMFFGLASVAMLFLGMTSAYIVRERLGEWSQIPMPPLMVVNTVILLASSITFEVARRSLSLATQTSGRSDAVAIESPSGFRVWMLATLAFGILFLLGQLAVWRQLSAMGVYLSSTPHSSFFYTLTGLHGAHLAGGVGALLYLAVRRNSLPLETLKRRAEATAIYWHFMDGLWVYLLLLLFVWS